MIRHNCSGLVIIAILFAFCVNLNAQDQDTDFPQASKLKFQSTSTFIYSQSFGLGKFIEDKGKSTEYFLMLRGGVGMYGPLEFANFGSVYMQRNAFLNAKHTGVMLIIEFGGTYYWIDDKSKERILPTVAVGTGYSFDIGKQKYLRISLDAGFKLSPVNINLSLIL